MSKCINKNTIFYKTLLKNSYTSKQIAQIGNKIEQKGFNDWYGEGKRDSFTYPEIVDNQYLINDKGQKITLEALLNDKQYEKRENYTKDLTYLDKVENFLNDARIGITKRINAYKGSDYAERLENLLKDLDSLNDNDHVKALETHTKYILKTVEDFENRLYEHDRVLDSKRTKEQKAEYDKKFKNFLAHATNFLNTFSKTKELETPKIEGLEIGELIKKLKDTETRVTELKNKIDSEIEAAVRDTLVPLISNPEIRNGIIDFLAAQVDEGKAQLLLDALGDSHVPFLAAVDKYFKLNMSDKEDEAKQMKKNWKKFVDSFAGGFDTFLDRIYEKKDGKRTGRFIQEYSEEFYNQLFDFTGRLNDLKALGKVETEEYQNLLHEYFNWRKENIEQKYKLEYYDALNLITPEAREARSSIDEKKSAILAKGVDKLSTEDFEELKKLDEEMKWLKSSLNRNGSSKTGKDLEIAQSLFKYSQELSKFYHTTGIAWKAYNKARIEAEEKGRDYLEKFNYYNTSEQYSDEFWKKFSDIIGQITKSESVENINTEIKQLLIGYRNERGEVKASEIPEDIRKKVQELEKDKKILQSEIRKTVSLEKRRRIAQEFKKLVQYVPSSEYVKVLADMKAKLEAKEITQEEYDKWYKENHEEDVYSEETIPINIWRKIRPVDYNYIKKLPNNFWKVTDIKPEYYNPNFDLDASGYALPTSKWKNSEYENLTKEDKEGLANIKDTLLYLVEHSKDNAIKKGFIPSVPNKITKKTQKLQEAEKTINEADEIVKFIPLRYVKKLNQQELPEVKEGMTEEEILKTLEERKRISKENNLYHAETVSYDLANTMKTFINAALTSKYETNMEADIKLFAEQLKQQKIKKTDAGGRTILDKLKGLSTGKKEAHEVSAIGSNTEKHFKEWLDSVFYEDTELDEGLLSDITGNIQSFTSLRALGFNVLSGLNNKLIGNLQERIEGAGGRFFSYKDYRSARKLYAGNILNYINEHKKEDSTNFLTAYIKHFDVLVSQDELSNKPEGVVQTVLHKAKLLRSSAYLMQHVGEHQIQNTTLIAMSKSHRIIDGKIMSFSEYWETKQMKVNIEEKWEDAVKIIEANYELKKSLIEEFDSHTALIDAYEFKDGYVKIKDDIKVDKNELHNFKQRVLGINQRLHGIYNVEDAGTIQRYALGRLAIQFRKWMKPGWNRRFGNKFGKKVYNERIRDYEEGMYVTTAKYLASPFITNYKQYRANQENIANSVAKTILNGFRDLLFKSKIRWYSMSEMEKANVKKTTWEMLFLVGVIGLGFLIKNIRGNGDDDKLKNKILAGLLYECDRLFGELTTYTPIGVVREGNRLFSSPSPVMNTLEDSGKLFGAIFMYPFRDEESRVFKTGIYHGEDRVSVYAQDLIPVYNQFRRLLYLSENNQRYNMFR